MEESNYISHRAFKFLKGESQSFPSELNKYLSTPFLEEVTGMKLNKHKKPFFSQPNIAFISFENKDLPKGIGAKKLKKMIDIKLSGKFRKTGIWIDFAEYAYETEVPEWYFTYEVGDGHPMGLEFYLINMSYEYLSDNGFHDEIPEGIRDVFLF